MLLTFRQFIQWVEHSLNHIRRLIEEPKVPDNSHSHRYEGGMVRPIGDRYPMSAPLGAYKWNKTEDAIERIKSNLIQIHLMVMQLSLLIHQQEKQLIKILLLGCRSFQKDSIQKHTVIHTHTIYNVFKGSGYSVINGVRFDWSEGDYFVVPNWAWHEHVADEDTYLFSCSDLPIMDNLILNKDKYWI